MEHNIIGFKYHEGDSLFTSPKGKSFVQEWVTALRSGEYEQGRGRLRGCGYCCLGVACEVAQVDQVLTGDGYVIFDGQEKILPNSVMNRLHLRTPSGRVLNSGTTGEPDTALTRLNDFYGFSFNQIANVIELFWEKQFGEALF